jgi:UDP-N-acetylglucosamine enolpyruvyl transferase
MFRSEKSSPHSTTASGCLGRPDILSTHAHHLSGCAIGIRPVDFLIVTLQNLVTEIKIDGGYVIARPSRSGRVGDPWGA